MEDIKTIQKLAEKGDAEAQKKLGNCYYDGEGVEQSYEKAVEWYTKAAEQGDASAQYNLGNCYYVGEGVEQSYEKAVEWYTKAAEQGEASAQFNLALCYSNGQGVTQSYEKAVYWYTKAAEQGEASAQFNLGYCYNNGEGVEQSYEKAVEWYTKAAEQGEASAQFKLGYCYNNGEGVEQSYEKAVEWYTKAAEQGKASAQCNLGYCYYNGKGIEQSYEKAVEWYTKAAEQGDSLAQIKLALCYFECEGVEQSYEKSEYWLIKAAEQGDKDYQSFLGNCYYVGKVVEQSYEKAVEWYTKAAEQGDASAQYNLALCYENGNGVEQSYEKSVEWYTKAAEQGDASAQYNLGNCYYDGEGVEQSYEKAVEWFLKANDSDEDEFIVGRSSYYLADCYHNGYGVKTDLKKAKEYYEKAIKNGYNCSYALQMVDRDIQIEDFYLEELNKIPIGERRRESIARNIARERYASQIQEFGAQVYVNNLLQQDMSRDKRATVVEEDLKKSFGKYWENGLKENAKSSLRTGILLFASLVEYGKEVYQNLDFAPVINQLSKAYEIELKEYFAKGFLKYLKHKGVPYSEFVKVGAKKQLPIIKEIMDKSGEVVAYNYADEENNSFSLGSLYYLVGSEALANRAMAMHCDKIYVSDKQHSVSNDKIISSRKTLGDMFSERTINKHVLEYAKLLFSEDAFGVINRDKEIVNYLIDLTTDTKTIANYRNPGSHESTMAYDQAATATDYLVMIHKVIYKFIEKINPKYLKDGFYI